MTHDIEYDMTAGWVYNLRLWHRSEKATWVKELATIPEKSTKSPKEALLEH